METYDPARDAALKGTALGRELLARCDDDPVFVVFVLTAALAYVIAPLPEGDRAKALQFIGENLGKIEQELHHPMRH